VFALEASRLARSNVDWHRLLQLCGADTDSRNRRRWLVTDPADFNDGLCWGSGDGCAKRSCHFLHARLQGGKLNKAKKR